MADVLHNPMTWVALVACVWQGLGMIQLQKTRKSFGELTEELKRAARDSDAVVLSNQNTVNWLARRTGTSPFPLPSDDEGVA